MASEKLNERWAAFLPVLEMIPLIVFVLVRSAGWTMPQRIGIGGALAILIGLLQFSRMIPVTPLYAAANVFFVLAGAILLLPFTALADLALALAEVGMFSTMLLVAAIWHGVSPTGLFIQASSAPATKKYSWMLLGVYALCPAIALHFKGNENLAGALPFILLTLAEKTLVYCQSRELKRKLHYAK